MKENWTYLYRGGDKDRQTLDFFVRARRDIAATKQFLQRAIKKCGVPQKITLDGYAASHVAVGELQAEGTLPATLRARTSRSLNNVIEQGHRRVKQRVRPLLGCKRFDHAALTVSGIEFVHQIKIDQFDISTFCPAQTRTPQLWESVLAA